MAINQELLMEMYEDEELRKEFKANPRAFLTAHGVECDEATEYRVLEDSAEVRHIVIPHPNKDETKSAEELENRISKKLI
ncbi:MAG: nitrile hydratase subunit alpha [bacterium]